MILPVFVINMASQPAAYKTVAASIEAYGQGFQLHRIDAVNGHTATQRIGIDDARFDAINGREMLPGEYGCYRSHLKALESFLSDGSPYGLILEDDVVFTETTSARIHDIIKSLPDFDVVKLVNHRSPLFMSLLETDAGDRIGRAIHGPQGSAAAYLVSREGARKLLSALSTMELPWDIAAISLLVFMSTVWVETDAYRYIALGFVVAALIRYARTDFWKYEKPMVGWAGLLCVAWTFYVLARFAYIYLFYPEMGTGSAEGIYLFPLFYPTLGFALLLFIRRPFLIAVAFMAISLVILIFGFHYDLSWNERAVTLLQHNPIHAAVSSGFIALCAMAFGIHTLNRNTLDTRARVVLCLLALATFIAALIAIYSLYSKGVWLAMAIAFPTFVVLVALTDKSQTSRMAALVCILIGLLSVFAGEHILQRVGGNTANTSWELLSDLKTGDNIMQDFDKAIKNPETGLSERERLMIWANTLHIWHKNPIFGAGVSWLHYWEKRPYQQTDFTLLHNGYLEIAIRYGFLGLLFYGVLTVWAVRCTWQATRAGLIDSAAFQCYVATLVFFAVTILSNSNVRLAIGESYMALAFGFAFYCQYLLQQHNRQYPRTYF
ncbi:O-antigen ligase family protein [Brucella melitensis]|uniref:O-antigen ligase family protein n=1 Tax=Brucella melitensis TaxID=29459 RepID=UPI0023F691BB|nr:O-antigen ligase family protein [Brucella melitensis]